MVPRAPQQLAEHGRGSLLVRERLHGAEPAAMGFVVFQRHWVTRSQQVSVLSPVPPVPPAILFQLTPTQRPGGHGAAFPAPGCEEGKVWVRVLSSAGPIASWGLGGFSSSWEMAPVAVVSFLRAAGPGGGSMNVR